MKNSQILKIAFILFFVSSILLSLAISEWRIAKSYQKATVTNERIDKVSELLNNPTNNIIMEVEYNDSITYNQLYNIDNIQEAKELLKEINQSVAFMNGVCLR